MHILLHEGFTMVKIIKPSYKILTETNPLKKIERAARTCYQSFDKEAEGSDVKLVKHLIKREHWAMIEHANIILEISSDKFKDAYWQISCDLTKGGYGLGNSIIEPIFLRCTNFNRKLISGNLRAFYEYIIKNIKRSSTASCVLRYLQTKIPIIFDDIANPHEIITNDCENGIFEIIDPKFLIPEEREIHDVMTVKFIANRGFCYDDQTEVLTEEGWKLFKNTKENDKFITLNMKTKEVEYQKRIGTTIEDWDSDLIYGKSTMVDFAVTPNHRMLWYHYDSRNPTWKINKAEEVFNRRVKFQRGLFNNYKENKKIQQADLINYTTGNELTLSFARFMGIFITDGSKWKDKKGSGRITIIQHKESGRNYIRKVLKDIGYHFYEDTKRFRISNIKLYNFLTQYFPAGEKRYETARIPKFIRFASKEYISAFLEGVIVGDGNIHKSGHKVIYTTNYKLAGDYQECVLKSGKCSSIRTDNRVGQKRYNAKISNIIENKRICYIVSITDRTNEHLFNKKHWSKKHYKGKVYCVTVPNGILYVRRNGRAFWSGNTHELVRHRSNCSFGQESSRYVDYGKSKHGGELTIINPPWLEMYDLDFLNDIVDFCRIYANDFHKVFRAVKNNDYATHIDDFKPIFYWIVAMRNCENSYFNLRSLKLKPEQARAVLPIGIKSEIVCTATLKEWKHIFNLRTASYAHPLIRGLMRKLCTEVKKQIPKIFDDIEW